MISNSSPAQTHPFGYRPDIDGLRAVAILLVLFFHAFPEALTGGFVGVDVFFVISGFLITSILLKEMRGGSFSFLKFYGRRILRIFPALLLTLFFVYGFGWFALFGSEFAQLGKHTLGAATFMSNFILWFESGYFDVASDAKPLLHLWSLAIEEQFYIFWPLLLWLTRKIGLLSLVPVVLVAGFSLIFSVYLTPIDGIEAFFSPITRFWEIMLGSILAYIVSSASVMEKLKFQHRFVPHFKNLISLFGLFLILLSAIKFSKGTLFPAERALLPTTGALFIILAGPQGWLNRFVLARREFVWIGLISYPLYLWHWPLFTYARLSSGGELSLEVSLILIGLSFLIAWFTYRCVEQPLKLYSRERTKIIFLIALMTILAVFGSVTMKEKGFPGRYKPHKNDLDIRSAIYTGPNIRACDFKLTSTADSYCFTTSDRPNIAIIGDSHAGHLLKGFSDSNDSFYNKALLIYAGGCQPTIGSETRPGCDLALSHTFEVLKRMSSIKYVLVSSYYDVPHSHPPSIVSKFSDGYVRTLQELLKLGKKVIFVMDSPTLIDPPTGCETPNLFLRRAFKKSPPSCVFISKHGLRSHDRYLDYVRNIREKVPSIYFYDPTSLFCNADTCLVSQNGNLLFSDFNHMSVYGSRLISNDIIRKIKSDFTTNGP